MADRPALVPLDGTGLRPVPVYRGLCEADLTSLLRLVSGSSRVTGSTTSL